MAGLELEADPVTDWLDLTDERIARWQRAAIAVRTDDLITLEKLADVEYLGAIFHRRPW
ncbi:MAG: hypothetical protein OEQ47_15465 [Acidimicrobiia bacterium]|nr:hypothetical protein [Acidimicrobiia bacterium]